VLPAVLLFLIPIEVDNFTDDFPKINLLTVPKIMAGVIKINEVLSEINACKRKV